MTEEPEEKVDETPEAPEAEAEEKPKAAKKRAPRTKKKEEAPEAAAEEAPEADEPEAVEDEQPEADEVEEPDADEDAAEDDEEQPAAKKRGGRRQSADVAAKKRRSRRPRPDAEPVFVRAQAKYVRSSPRKARLVVDHIRGKSVPEARAILAHTPRAAAVPVLKVLESAIANAEHNHELLPEELRIHQVMVDEGPTIKRFRPRALGRATKIRKRTAHITINLTNTKA
jgi:large subunit ribosomal protein L22